MLSVLIVDDEAYVLEGVEKNVPWGQFGIDRVYKAKTGKEGLAAARELQPDIIISDVRMPHMNGLDMAEALRDLNLKFRLILMSAYSELEYYKKAMKLHAVSFIEKPIVLEELTEEIRRAAEQIEMEKSGGRISEEEAEKFAFLELIQEHVHTFGEHMKRELLNKQSFLLLAIGRLEETADGEKLRRQLSAVLPFGTKLYLSNDGAHCLVLAASSSSLERYASKILNQALTLFPGQRPYVTAACFRQAEDLASKYRAVIDRQTYGFFHEEAWAETVPKEECQLDGQEEAAFRTIRKEMETGNWMRVKTDTAAYFARISRGKGVSPDRVKGFAFRLLNALAASRKTEFSETRRQEGDSWEKLHQSTSFEGVRQYCMDQIQTMIAQVEEIQEKGRGAFVIRQEIDRHYMVPGLSIGSLADKLHFSESYLSSLFKKQYHMTVGEYINQKRMEQAKQLLLDPCARINDVAAQVGFDNTDYFTKRFRKYTGKTPSEYRR